MSVISSIAIQVTREHPKSYKGIPRVQATNTRVALSKQFQDLIEPSQDGYFSQEKADFATPDPEHGVAAGFPTGTDGHINGQDISGVFAHTMGMTFPDRPLVKIPD